MHGLDNGIFWHLEAGREGGDEAGAGMIEDIHADCTHVTVQRCKVHLSWLGRQQVELCTWAAVTLFQAAVHGKNKHSHEDGSPRGEAR